MELPELPKNKKIILFDGVCNLCDKAVQYVIKHDTKDIFRFVALQSDLGQQIIKHIGIDTKHIDSIILFEPGIAYYYKSAAAIEIAKELGGIFTMAMFFRLLPQFLRDRIYDHIARNRYKWHGRKDKCMIPSPEIKAKFL